MDKIMETKFWIVSSGIMFHSSWRTTYSCLRDGGGGNLLLTLLCKTDHTCLMIFKSGNCAGQGRCWSASSCSSNQDWTLLVVCMGEVLSWKIASLLGGKKLDHTMHHVVPGSNLTSQSNFGTSIMPRYCCPCCHRSPPYFTVETRHSGL
jgi:hypothetical protein